MSIDAIEWQMTFSLKLMLHSSWDRIIMGIKWSNLGSTFTHFKSEVNLLVYHIHVVIICCFKRINNSSKQISNATKHDLIMLYSSVGL
jgi:hypothetical protein